MINLDSVEAITSVLGNTEALRLWSKLKLKGVRYTPDAALFILELAQTVADESKAGFKVGGENQ